MNVLPAIQDGVFRLFGSSVMRVPGVSPNNTRWLIQNFPASLPRCIANICLFKIGFGEEWIETSEFEEFVTIERAACFACVSAGIRNPYFWIRAVVEP
jgi:hypothetical protein